MKSKKKFAKVQAVINRKPEPIYFHFYKEQEKWRIDLSSTFSTANEGIKQMIDQSGQDENEYLFNLLEMTSGEKPKSDIWQTIKE